MRIDKPKIVIGTLQITLILFPALCFEHYTAYNQKCYKAISDPLNYTAAEESCLSMGGHLVSVNDAAESAAVLG